MRTPARTFIDTNIIIYAYYNQHEKKHRAAETLLTDFWNEAPFPSLSIQVLLETYVNLVKNKVSPKIATTIIESFYQWNVVPNDILVFQQGLNFSQNFGISLWDGCILSAAKASGAKFLLSEDFTHQRSYDGITVINPFV